MLTDGATENKTFFPLSVRNGCRFAIKSILYQILSLPYLPPALNNMKQQS